MLRDGVERAIKPVGAIEENYVFDIACITWEMLRLRRCKKAIINAKCKSAVARVLIPLLAAPWPEEPGPVRLKPFERGACNVCKS